MTTTAWVIGDTGQLGSALTRRLERDPEVQLLRWRIRWEDPQASIADLAEGLEAWIAKSTARLHLYWAAGAAVTSTGVDESASELAVFERFADALHDAVASHHLGARVSLFFASSVGGLYSGSAARAPFDERSPVAPVSAYGRGKLAMETAMGSAAIRSASRLLIGRISTLYGARQRFAKPQGFVAQLCRSYILRQPLGVYVSLDTLRDYVHADDAAAIIVEGMGLLDSAERGSVVVKNVASLTPTTLGEVIHQAKLVFKRSPNLVLAVSPLARGQVRDLRIASAVWPELDDLPRRSLVNGIAATRAALEMQMRAGKL